LRLDQQQSRLSTRQYRRNYQRLRRIDTARVCRDYAHLAIALCRALCIPARYISGYAVALQPPDFHGFFEAYLGSRWYLFDATRMAPVEGFVCISTGRDAADASFATIIAKATLTYMAV
jgi:transglutaminase-like putative cysteine protease